MLPEIKRLFSNLNEFIRKYYWDKVIRGSLYFFGALFSLYLLLIALEYFVLFSTQIKTFIFYTYWLGAVLLFTGFIGIPIARMIKILPRLSYENAAQLIGRFYPDIDDKLLNTVQLYQNQQSFSEHSLELLNASLEQRIQSFGVFRFKKLIRFRFNAKYLKYTLIPLLFLAFLFLPILPWCSIVPSAWCSMIVHLFPRHLLNLICSAT